MKKAIFIYLMNVRCLISEELNGNEFHLLVKMRVPFYFTRTLPTLDELNNGCVVKLRTIVTN